MYPPLASIFEQNVRPKKEYDMKRHFIALAAAATMFAAGAAAAQTANCAPRTAIVDRLASKYGESRQSIGLGTNNAVVEVFASADTGTWTILFTRPDGISCLMAAGQGFEMVAEAPIAAGEPT